MRVTLPDQATLNLISSHLPDGIDAEVWDFTGPPPSGVIDLAVFPFLSPPTHLQTLKGSGVVWVQGLMLGYDGVGDNLPSQVGYCNVVGIYEPSTADQALALTIAAQRNLPRFFEAQKAHLWTREPMEPGLSGRTALVIGVGGVGSLIAQRLRGCDVEVLRSASHARSDEFGDIAGPEQLPDLLPEVDIVVLATALNAATHHMANADFFARMKDGALLVNIGRGPLVDTDALVAATPRIRAALDVIEPEPLPAGHPLWDAPGVIITPHIAGFTNQMPRLVAGRLIEQITRYQAGQPLLDVVFSPGR